MRRALKSSTCQNEKTVSRLLKLYIINNQKKKWSVVENHKRGVECELPKNVSPMSHHNTQQPHQVSPPGIQLTGSRQCAEIPIASGTMAVNSVIAHPGGANLAR